MNYLDRVAFLRVVVAVLGLAVIASPAICTAAPTTGPQVEMTIENRGKVIIELLSRDAPKTSAHFLELVKSGFYNGILFHRVVPNFVAQAGDPGSRKLSAADVASRDDHQGGTTGLGAGGSKPNGGSANIPFEENDLTNERGTISMALSGSRTATGDSQFFVNLKTNHTLDGDYCVFARVVKGMDIIEKVKRGDRIVSALLMPRKPSR